MQKRVLRYFHFIGIFLLIFILIKIDFKEIVLYFKNAKLTYLLIAYPCLLLMIFLKSFRWNLLMRHQGVKFSQLRTFYIYIWAFYFGVVTPSRVGEISKTLYVQDKFENFGEAFVSVFLDRFLDIAIMFLIVLLIYPFYYDLFELRLLTGAVLTIILIAVIIYLFQNKNINELIIRLIRYITPQKYYQMLKQNFTNFIEDFIGSIKNLKLMGVSIFITSLSFFIYCIMSFMILKSLNVQMTFFYNIFCIVVSGVVVILPISISGLGVRELTMIYLFNRVNLDKEAAVLFSLSLFSISIILGMHGWIANVFMMINEKRKSLYINV